MKNLKSELLKKYASYDVGTAKSFIIPIDELCPFSHNLYAIANTRDGWDYVLVSVKDSDLKSLNRYPTWDEMSYIRSMFFRKHETVIQLNFPEDTSADAFELGLFRSRDQNIIHPTLDVFNKLI